MDTRGWGSSENGLMRAATPATEPAAPVTAQPPVRVGSGAPTPARVAGALALLVLLAALAVLVCDAAAGPTQYVPAHSGGWPGWLAGPLAGVGARLASGGFQALMLIV